MINNVQVVVSEISASDHSSSEDYARVTFKYKHRERMAIWLHIPREQWKSQYSMWNEYSLSINEDGTLTLKKP